MCVSQKDKYDTCSLGGTNRLGADQEGFCCSSITNHPTRARTRVRCVYKIKYVFWKGKYVFSKANMCFTCRRRGSTLSFFARGGACLCVCVCVCVCVCQKANMCFRKGKYAFCKKQICVYLQKACPLFLWGWRLRSPWSSYHFSLIMSPLNFSLVRHAIEFRKSPGRLSGLCLR